MMKTILIGGIFFVVIFFLLPNNENLNNLGMKIIGIYFLAAILYFPIAIFWMLFKKSKTPIEDIDHFIYKKWFKKITFKKIGKKNYKPKTKTQKILKPHKGTQE